jgi:hypothetical protein
MAPALPCLQTWLDWVADDQAEQRDTSGDYKQEEEEEEDSDEEGEAHVLAMEDPYEGLKHILDRVSCSSKVSLGTNQQSFLEHL